MAKVLGGIGEGFGVEYFYVSLLRWRWRKMAGIQSLISVRQLESEMSELLL